jgi:hypothetical protein
MSTPVIIKTYDMPISFTKKTENKEIIEDQRTIRVDDPTRSTITMQETGNSEPTVYNIEQIFICKPPNYDKDAYSFDIIFQYTFGYNFVYIQVPVKIDNYSQDSVNAEFTDFIGKIQSTGKSKSFRMNLSELFESIKNNYKRTSSQRTGESIIVIQYNTIHLNTTKPTTIGSILQRLDLVDESAKFQKPTMTVKPAPRNFRKNKDYNPESRDPSRTIPIEIYKDNNKAVKNKDNLDNIKPEIKKKLQTYTGLIIFCIVVGFILATLYVIMVLIPDSKLRVTRQTKTGGGGWSLRKTWNAVYHKMSHIFR